MTAALVRRSSPVGLIFGCEIDPLHELRSGDRSAERYRLGLVDDNRLPRLDGMHVVGAGRRTQSVGRASNPAAWAARRR